MYSTISRMYSTNIYVPDPASNTESWDRDSTYRYYLIWASSRKKKLSWGGGGDANNKGGDQPAHPRSLNSAFGIRLMEIFVSRLATSEITIFLLASVADKVGLNLTLSETPKTGFLASRPI